MHRQMSTCDPSSALAMTSSQWMKAGGSLDHYRSIHRCNTPAPDRSIARDIAVDGQSTTFLMDVGSDLASESVVMTLPTASGRIRTTLCLSSQIGCAMGCEFCQTGTMGLLGNMTTAQIVAQHHAAVHDLGQSIDNIVFMGMGEPLDNVDAVLGAVDVLLDHNGPAIAAKGLSVSTVGHVPGLHQFIDATTSSPLCRIGLAISLNAPSESIRRSIMPIARAWPMTDLLEAMMRWSDDPRRRPILIEYVLIPSVNDDPAHAEMIAAYLKGVRCKINVIPYNPRRDSPWPSPTERSVSAMTAALHDQGLFVRRRVTTGRRVFGACGQLGGRRDGSRGRPIAVSTGATR